MIEIRGLRHRYGKALALDVPRLTIDTSAVLVGHTTYGKGSVQTVMPLSGGRAVKLTTSRDYTPSGASIQDKGITPDIVIDGKEVVPAAATAASDREVRIALDTLKSRRRLASAAH